VLTAKHKKNSDENNTVNRYREDSKNDVGANKKKQRISLVQARFWWAFKANVRDGEPA